MSLYGQQSSGGMGSVEIGGREREHRRRPGVVAVRLLMSAGVIGLIWTLGLQRYPVVTGKIIVLGIGLTAGYLLVAFFLRPRADLDNLNAGGWGSWGGGLFHRRARFSASVSQWMLVLGIVLWPGRFVAETLHDLWWLATGRNATVAERPEQPEDQGNYDAR